MSLCFRNTGSADLSLQSLEQAVKMVAKHDLGWFLSLTDCSITTFIRNCTMPCRRSELECYKDSITEACSKLDLSVSIMLINYS